jgi:hypothetical protein
MTIIPQLCFTIGKKNDSVFDIEVEYQGEEKKDEKDEKVVVTERIEKDGENKILLKLASCSSVSFRNGESRLMNIYKEEEGQYQNAYQVDGRDDGQIFEISSDIDQNWKPETPSSDSRYDRLEQHISCLIEFDSPEDDDEKVEKKVVKVERSEVEYQVKDHGSNILKIGHKSNAIVRFREISKDEEVKKLYFVLNDIWLPR